LAKVGYGLPFRSSGLLHGFGGTDHPMFCQVASNHETGGAPQRIEVIVVAKANLRAK
jgi:hypothetical protein